MKNNNLKYQISIIVFFLFLFSNFYFADAQIPIQFLVSWQADSSVPSWYKGKVFPTKDSVININFELIDNGQSANLSKTAIRWYINDKLVKNEKDGLGIKSLKFIVGDYPGQKTEIRISIPSYKNSSPLDKIVSIAVARPQVVIDAPYAGGEISVGKNIFQAVPFFFSTKDPTKIFYKWFVDNREVTNLGDNFKILDLNIPNEAPKGTVINIKANVKNLLKDMESAVKILDVKIK